MNPYFLVFTLLFSCSSIWAAEFNELSFQLGTDLRFESSVSPEVKELVPGVAGGAIVSWGQWELLEELVFLQSSSKTGYFQVKYQTLEWNQWFHYRLKTPSRYKPYAGLGFGFSQDKVTSNLSGNSRVDKSRLFLNGGLKLGVAASIHPYVFLVGEVRGWKFEQKKDPMLSGLFSLRFNLEKSTE